MFNAIEIEINSYCNKACSYCPNSEFERVEKGNMSKTLFNKILHDLQVLNFTGRVSYNFYNEPLLNKDLEEFIVKTRENLPLCNIVIYSNGSMLSLIKLLNFFKLGVDKFIITKHEDVRDELMDEMIASLPDTLKTKVDFKKFDEINLTNRGGALLHLGDNEKTKFLPCKIPQKLIVITKDGNVLPCFEDYFQKNIMGNVNKNTLTEIWNSQKFEEFRKNLQIGLRFKYEACKDCNRIEVL